MNKNLKFTLALLLLFVAGSIFTYYAWITRDIPYFIMGIGILAAAVVIAIFGLIKKDK